MAQNNLKRVFADVISIDAWHTPFTSNSGIAALHVDAVFSTARLGGESSSPIRFRLSLSRAELVAIIPDNEPLEVLRSSVSRDQTIESVAISRTSKFSSGKHMRIAGKVNGASPIIAAINADMGLGMEAQQSSASSIDQKTPLILMTQSKTVDGHYRWELKPAAGPVLLGRAWDAAKDPRLQLRDKRKSSSHLLGSARVEIRCKREDLIIEDIEIKDQPLLARLRSATTLRNKIVAVEAYLKNALSSEKLHFAEISDPFGDICLADLIVEEAGNELGGGD